MELSFETLTKILSKETNQMLDNFIEYIDTTCDSYSLIDIVKESDNYTDTEWHNLISGLANDLKEYDVTYDDEDELTDEGYDFLILYVQKQILDEHHQEFISCVFGGN